MSKLSKTDLGLLYDLIASIEDSYTLIGVNKLLENREEVIEIIEKGDVPIEIVRISSQKANAFMKQVFGKDVRDAFIETFSEQEEELSPNNILSELKGYTQIDADDEDVPEELKELLTTLKGVSIYKKID